MEKYAGDVREAYSVLRSASKNPSSQQGSVRELVETWLNKSKHERFFLEYMLSALEGDTSTFLGKWLLDNFPSNADAFAITDMWSALLCALSENLYTTLNPLPTQPADDLGRRRGRIQICMPVLDILCKIASPQAPDSNRKKTRGKHSQKDAELGPQLGTSTLAALRRFGIDVPQTYSDVDATVKSMLSELKNSLETYLDILRRPDVLEVVYTTIDRLVNEAGNSHETDRPSAYPAVQPMKAALYFDNAEGFGEWRVLVSTRADKTLRETRNKEPTTFKIIVNKIKDLSHGHFSDDNQIRLNVLEVGVPIYEAKMTRDLRLVYQVDCVHEFGTDYERQALKIFGIYTHATLDRGFWNSVGSQLAKRGGKDYNDRCTYRTKPARNGDDVYEPASFPPPEPLSAATTVQFPMVRTEDLDELHELLVLEKFVTFSQAFLNGLLANHDVIHPFAVSPEEQEVIEYPHSCYVIGRSGTGKTTTMLFKILGIEHTYQQYRDCMPRPRQVFVTQSRVLANKVEEYFAKMLESLVVAGHSPKELTQIRATRERRDEQLVDLDDEENWRSELPKKFSELQDDHFPLFITYDKLCRLLEADCTQSDLNLHASNEEDDHADSNEYMLQTRDAFVSYTVFLRDYWPHLPQTSTKGLDPALVFSEFLGVIKGSEKALLCEDRYLDRATYEDLSHRSQSTFARQRQVIYNLFQAYNKRRIDSREYDSADRTHRILKALQERGIPGKKISRLYVDEVQDNLLIDILVLRMLCADVNGLFFAGDTAQTISVGSSFRFDDLKAFMYRVEEQACASVARSNDIKRPRSFQLLVNYRSHGGIVTCAASIIHLITTFWPYAIDTLDEERGIIDGLKPVFFHGWDTDTVGYKQFLFGETGAPLEFGAQQCILVRNEAARQRLRNETGNVGLILTLYESKGLEFNDVLLYNFFEDSNVTASQWRVILNAETRGNSQLDENRRAGVCAELKFLYVAVTRARKNLWIADCSEKSEPIRTLWTGSDLISDWTPGMVVPKLAISSASEEWALTATTLFKRKQYAEAVHAYERAGLHREQKVAHAYHLREQARSVMGGTPKLDADRTKAFLRAAKAFIACAKDASNEKMAYLRVAGRCHVEAGDDGKAARCFLNAADYTLAAQHFRVAGLFDEAVDVLHKHGHSIDSTAFKQIRNAARIHYFIEGQLEKAGSLFHSNEEQLDFLEEHDFGLARANLLESMGRTANAIELYRAEGRPLDVIRLMLSDVNSSTSAQQAVQCIIEQLWTHLSFGATALKSASGQANVRQLLAWCGQLHAIVKGKDADEIAMFQALATSDCQQLRRLAQNVFQQTGNKAAALLCFEHLCNPKSELQLAGACDVSEILPIFNDYGRLLRDMLAYPNSSRQAWICRLFGIEVPEKNASNCFVPTSTYLHKQIIKAKVPDRRLTPEGITLSQRNLSTVIRNTVIARLKRCLAGLDKKCWEGFSAYIADVVDTDSGQDQGPEQHSAANDTTWYRARAMLHLQQAVVLHSLMDRIDPSNRIRYECRWLRRLYDCLFPPVPDLQADASAILSALFLPEAAEGKRVVTEWIREYLLRVSPQDEQPPLFLTEFMQIYSVALVLDEPSAEYNISRALCVKRRPPPYLLRSTGTGNIKASILEDLGCHWNNSHYMVLALSHIVNSPIVIDISVLLHFMENLCGRLIIVANRLTTPALHDVILPLSWMTRLARLFSKSKHEKHDRQVVDGFVGIVDVVLDDLLNQKSHLVFQGQESGTFSAAMLSALVARTCQCACILGYNVADPVLRTRIHNMITTKTLPSPLPGCDQYFKTTEWEGLTETLRRRASTPRLEELVQLHHSSVPTSTPLPRTCRVIFTTISDILRHFGVNDEVAPTLKAGGEIANQPTSEAEPPNELVQADAKEHRPEPTNLLADAQVIDPNAVESSIPSNEQIAQAAKILRAYRRFTQRLAGQHGRAEMLSTIFSQYLPQSEKMTGPHRHYRQLYLGPLLHLIVCLREVQQYALATKSDIKSKRKTAHHSHWDELGERQTQMTQLAKKAKDLDNVLSPGAEVHRQRNVQSLKALVPKVEALVKMLPADSGIDLSEDLALGVKGIVTLARPSTEKPT